jgi:hypothetical protein
MLQKHNYFEVHAAWAAKKLFNFELFWVEFFFINSFQISITFDPYVQKIRNLYSREAYCILFSTKKFCKIPKFIALVGACPNQPKPIFVLIVL